VGKVRDFAKELGGRPENWDVERGPVRINLTKPKTTTKYYNFLPPKGAPVPQGLAEREAGGDGGRSGRRGGGIRPYLREQQAATHVREAGREHDQGSVVQDWVQLRTAGVNRYRIHGHEFRDAFKTTCKVAGVDGAVAEFFIGHEIDSLGYDKSPWAYPEHFREQYLLAEPYLSGEYQQYRMQAEKRWELEDRIRSLESLLACLASEEGLQYRELEQQALSQGQSRRKGT